MAYARKRRRSGRSGGRARKRKRTRAARRYSRRRLVPRYRNPFPKTVIRRLRYVAYHNIYGNSIQNTMFQTYRPNSIYDPDYTSTGGQPYGHDQLALVYNKYRVLGCRLTATVTPRNLQITPATSGTSAQFIIDQMPMVMGWVCDNDVSPSSSGSGSNPQTLFEMSILKKYMPAQRTYGATGKGQRFSVYYSPKTYNRMYNTGDRARLNELLEYTDFGANPTLSEPPYYHFCIGRVDGTPPASSDSFNVVFELEYIVQCSDQKEFAGS